MLLVKITCFFSLIYLIYLFTVKSYYSSSRLIKLDYKINHLRKENVWDSEIVNLIILGLSSIIEVILIVCSAFYLIFLR